MEDTAMLGIFSDMGDTLRWIDSLERQMVGAARAPAAPRAAGASDVPLSITDRGEDLVLTADLPGVEDKDVEITFEGDVLTLRADRSPAAPEGFKLVRSERTRPRLVRQIELGCRVDVDAVTASLEGGVLVVKMPKAAEAKPRRIPLGNGAPPAA
jgi:HSP20 family protein